MKTWQKGDDDLAAVYLLELDGAIRYVGETGSIEQRMRCHGVLPALLKPLPRKFKGLQYTFCKIYVIPEIDPLQRLKIESSLIRKHNPSHNQRKRPVSQQFKMFIEIVGSQAEAAKLLGISPSQISLLASGKRAIRPALAERIEIATQGRVTKESLVFGGRRA